MSESKITPELLVSRGLFPENLPSVFTANAIWPSYAAFGTSYAITSQTTGDICPYNASKRGAQRRIFGAPHPSFVRDQAVFFEKHWNEISRILDYSIGSVSKPRFFASEPRHIRITSHSELPKIRLRAFSRYKFCLITDVARFFPSVYTHTIPWALNGRDAAKSDYKYNSSAVSGNRLDFVTRQAQGRQTIGIPIGPDVSKITSELLLSSVDRMFIERSSKLKPTYIRHVDDYWIAGNSYEECEKHLQNIRQSLRSFELDINELKTKIVSTKYVFGDSWPYEFNKEISESFSPTRKRLGLDPVSTLGKIVDRATVENDDGIIRHAIRRIDETRLWSTEWDVLEHFLAQCAIQFPHSLDYVARVIAWRVRTGKPADRKLWLEVAKLSAAQNGAIGRDSETLWALWLLKELKGKVPKSISDIVVENGSGLVLSFLAHCHANSLTTDKDIRKKFWSRINDDPFAGALWPLTLELTHLGIADSAWAAKKPAQILTVLHDQRISIIDWDAMPKVFESELGESHEDQEAPDYAIEDFGDYGSDEANEEEDEETGDWPWL